MVKIREEGNLSMKIETSYALLTYDRITYFKN